jgi:CheY-like chemotaxis protein
MKPLTGRNILLVDDDVIFGKIMKKKALECGINLDSVESMASLESIHSLAKYDLLLLDYDLEDTTGFEIAEFLQKARCMKPVLLVSNTNRPWQDKLKTLPNITGFASDQSGDQQTIAIIFRGGKDMVTEDRLPFEALGKLAEDQSILIIGVLPIALIGVMIVAYMVISYHKNRKFEREIGPIIRFDKDPSNPIFKKAG